MDFYYILIATQNEDSCFRAVSSLGLCLLLEKREEGAEVGGVW